jgi:CIC family chloride channel protein
MSHIWQSFWSPLSRHILRPKRLAILEACLIGLFSALAAVWLGDGVGWLGGWRQRLAGEFPIYLVLPTVGFGGGFLAGWLVDRFAPDASGSGMSEVKAVLARVPLPLNLKIALVKWISATLVLASGMPLGKEGPTVQIGASLANQLSHWFPTSPDHRRQLIAAGAGAGLAAAFDAPIAGVLFVVEELLQDVSGITLGTAILASFIAAVVARILGSHHLDLNLHLEVSNTSFFAQEIPFYLLLGVIAGVLGVLFNRGILTSLGLNRRYLNVALPWRIGLAGCITGIVLATLPPEFHDNAGLRQLLLAGDTDWQLVLFVFATQFLLILVTSGSGAPGGLLIPSMSLGAALGYLVGLGEYHLLGLSLATTYARVGMAAFFSAVARTPITAVIIVFEMTTDFNLVLPLMIVSVTAYLIGEAIASGSLYDDLLKFKGIYLEKEGTSQETWTKLAAADVMQPRVETLASQMSVEEALQAFSQSSHRTFPVVEGGKLVGILTQTDLVRLSQQEVSGGTVPTTRTVADVMSPAPVSASPADTLAHILHLLNRYNLSSLPVTAGRRLVGIITRSDIIRVEAAALSGETNLAGPKAEPAQVVYQTRSPETGQGRILLPLCNPKTADILLDMAVAIAHDRQYEIECLNVITVPRHISPREAYVNTAAGQRLLRQATRLGQAWQIPVHNQIQVAHDLSNTILQTIKERHIDLVLMGWKGTTKTPGRVFSRVVDAVVRQAACDVVLVKLHAPTHFDRWLVPIAGGPNSQQAIKLLPALTALSHKPKVSLCQVFEPDTNGEVKTSLDHALRILKPKLNGAVTSHAIYNDSILEGILSLATAEKSEVIILGASREGLLQQAVHGNIPAAIARHSKQTLILVRGPL